VGTLGIAFVPALAQAATSAQGTGTHLTPTHSISAASAKATGLRTFSSPAGKTVRLHKAAVAGTAGVIPATSPNPNMSIELDGGDISAFGVEVDTLVGDYTSGTLSGTIDWGDGTTTSITDFQADPDTNIPTNTTDHTYAQLGTYTISVTVNDGEGDTASNSVDGAQTAGSEYTAYGPTRILDTRKGTGAPAAPVGKAGTLKLHVVGAGTPGDTIPAGITAVVLNVTVTQPTAGGYVSVYADQNPDGSQADPSGTSNLNFSPGEAIPNLVVAPVGPNGVVDLTNGSGGTVQLVADVAGYFTTDNTTKYASISPLRVLDTRKGTGTAGKIAKIPAGGNLTLTVAGAGGGTVPASGVSAVAMNLTTTDDTGGGYVTAYPAGQNMPTVSNLNFSANQTIANMAVVPVGTNGQIVFHNGSSGPLDLVADVFGYYGAGADSAYLAFPEPLRLIDTRQDGGALAAGTIVPMGLIPSEFPVTAGVLNATVTAPTAGGYLSVYPYEPSNPTVKPTTSNVNYSKGETIPNLVIAAPGTEVDQGAYDYAIYFGGSGSSQLILDLFGLYENA
jgi:hypothetical protein